MKYLLYRKLCRKYLGRKYFIKVIKDLVNTILFFKILLENH